MCRTFVPTDASRRPRQHAPGNGKRRPRRDRSVAPARHRHGARALGPSISRSSIVCYSHGPLEATPPPPPRYHPLCYMQRADYEHLLADVTALSSLPLSLCQLVVAYLPTGAVTVLWHGPATRETFACVVATPELALSPEDAAVSYEYTNFTQTRVTVDGDEFVWFQGTPFASQGHVMTYLVRNNSVLASLSSDDNRLVLSRDSDASTRGVARWFHDRTLGNHVELVAAVNGPCILSHERVTLADLSPPAMDESPVTRATLRAEYVRLASDSPALADDLTRTAVSLAGSDWSYVVFKGTSATGALVHIITVLDEEGAYPDGECWFRAEHDLLFHDSGAVLRRRKSDPAWHRDDVAFLRRWLQELAAKHLDLDSAARSRRKRKLERNAFTRPSAAPRSDRDAANTRHFWWSAKDLASHDSLLSAIEDSVGSNYRIVDVQYFSYGLRISVRVPPPEKKDE